MSGEPGLSIEELAERAGVSVRTVRYYISQGLLAGPANRGKYATYDRDHLARLRLIRRLVDQHVPLAELHDRLGHLSTGEVNALLADEERRSRELERARTSPSPREYVSGLLARTRSAPAEPLLQPEPVQRWELAPGVELYVRADSAQKHAHLIERLLESARDELGRVSK